MLVDPLGKKFLEEIAYTTDTTTGSLESSLDISLGVQTTASK
jgi:hypothetical protein